jgi:ferrous-iron efflux pump FieF
MTTRPLLLAIVATLGLGSAKLAVALATGSQAVLASAVDSLADAGVSALNLWLAREAVRPADEGHPFGHGKAEALAALAQAGLLAVVIGFVAAGAVRRLAEATIAPIHSGPAIGGMVLSMFGSLAISTGLARAAARTGSLVLRADAVHYRMDLLTGAAVVIGLVVTAVVAEPRADALASLLVCLLMTRDVAGLLRDAIGELMDRPLPPEETATVEAVLRGFEGRVCSWHDLRTRRAGPRRFVQVHVVLPADLSFAAAHDLSDAVEHAIRQALAQCDVMVHADVEGREDSTDAA